MLGRSGTIASLPKVLTVYVGSQQVALHEVYLERDVCVKDLKDGPKNNTAES